MENGFAWFYTLLFIGFLAYLGWIKPECGPGSVPIMGLGAGWYCAPGYKPG